MRTSSLRSRVTAVAGIAITLAVVLGVSVMYLLQMQAVRGTIDGELRTYVTEIRQSAQGGVFPKTLAPSTIDAIAEAQVLAEDGSVLAATASLAGLPAVYALPAASTTPVRQRAANGVIPADVRVLGERVTVGGRQVTIIVGTATNLLQQVKSEFLRHLLLGLPVILILAAGTVWLVVGRALRPVERIRHAVTDITSADLSRRVPDPGTSDEVGRLARTMNDMLDRLDASTRRQRQFVADASHELRSPLAAIRTTLEVGLAHPEEAPWPVIAERAAGQSVRLEQLIQQLLVLAKADEAELSAHDQPVDLVRIVAEVLESTAAHDREIEVVAPAAAATTGNADHLGRMLRNLLDNAIRHAHRRVLLTIEATDEAITLHVDDDGPGIPAADRERVFDRFVRLDASRQRASGNSGLGLAVARDIARAHGATITATEGPLGGARLTIVLPRSA